jgi:rSAM/selenodomain-associated transferase 1
MDQGEHADRGNQGNGDDYPDAGCSTRLTAIFTKHPTPGEVMTRLSPPLSPAAAARLAEAMLRDTVARCRGGRFRTVLVVTPPERAAWFAAEFAELGAPALQDGAELGERLARFTGGVFARTEAATLVVVGSDQPLVPAARIEEAHRALEAGAGCVLGPDRGGGYYLIGLARPAPELFTAVAMSSAGMCAATAELACAHGLTVVLLPEHGDVDVPADLERLRAELERPEHARLAPHTRAVLAELDLAT